MNKEDYVSMEVAKLLKEKGYKEFCTGCYRNNKFMNINSFNDADMFGGDFYSAPTLYEAAKWLRNQRDINVVVATVIPMWFDRIPNNNDNDTLYMPFIEYKKEDNKIEMATYRNLKDFNYEDVYNAGILEALKLI